MVVQPDGPLALDAKGRSPWPYPLLAYTLRTFNRLARTTVYMDAGSGDWVSAAKEARVLARSGIRYARGFALNLTHYDSTAKEIRYAKTIVRALAKRGLPDKHAIINTASNGRPWTHQQDRRAFFRGAVCSRASMRHCIVFGPRPTTQTGTPAVDALMWIGRSWVAGGKRRPASEIANLVRFSPFLTY